VGRKANSHALLGRWMGLTLLIPIVAVLSYAGAGRFPNANFFSVLGIGLLVAAAAGILGVLVGFLFALPRTTADTTHPGRLRTNTNLDEVSDWLTKILVGLGLVQIGKLAGGLDDLSETLAPGLGGEASAETFALALLVYSLIGGFLVGYLGTRLTVTIRLKEIEDLLVVKEEVLGKRLEGPPTLVPPAKEVEDLLAAKEEVLKEPPPEAPPPLPPSPTEGTDKAAP
jgi:hypothetical protein